MTKRASDAQRESVAILMGRNAAQQAIILDYIVKLEENIRLTGGDVVAVEDGLDDDSDGGGLDFWDEE